METSGQEGGVGGNISLPRTTTRTTTNSKPVNNQNCQKVEPHGTLTTQESKKHSSRPGGGVETGSRVGRQDLQQGGSWWGQGGAGRPGN